MEEACIQDQEKKVSEEVHMLNQENTRYIKQITGRSALRKIEKVFLRFKDKRQQSSATSFFFQLRNDSNLLIYFAETFFII